MIMEDPIDFSKFKNIYSNNIDGSGRFNIIDNLNLLGYSKIIEKNGL